LLAVRVGRVDVMCLPNFLIIGAPRSGTTSLYFYLKQHPEVYLSPIKEPQFFAFEGAKDPALPPWSTSIEVYESLFERARNEALIGEASPIYLHTPGCAERIRSHIPDVKMIAVLRNPVDRALSHYLHHRRLKSEKAASFATALSLEEKRIAEGYHPAFFYKNAGLYSRHLKRYYAIFEREQLHVLLYEDLVDKPSVVIREIFQFLGVDVGVRIDLSGIHNLGGVGRYRVIDEFVALTAPRNLCRYKAGRWLVGLWPHARRYVVFRRLLLSWNTKCARKPELASGLRERLVAFFQDDIMELQRLLDRDLSHWLV